MFPNGHCHWGLWTLFLRFTSTPPPGLIVNIQGQIRGTPSAAGAYTLNIQVTDSLGNIVSQAFQLSISPPAATSLVSALPHFAAQDVWTTGIFVINTSATNSANFSISFYDDTENAQPLPFPTGATSVLTGTIPALGSSYYEASNPSLAAIDGWGRISADPQS
jgi:hypothetical protein